MLKFIKEKFMAIAIVTILVLGVGIVLMKVVSSNKSAKGLVEVAMPELTPPAVAGKNAFDANCAQCHGINGAGTDQGPPLIHDIYNPGHHSNRSFLVAVERGVPAHHWRFGNMPPVPDVKRSDIADIVRFIREVQQANGIFYKPHRM